MSSTFTWDPDRIFFVIPYLRHPVTWYGLLFATGFLVGYFLVRQIFLTVVKKRVEDPVESRILATKLTDRLAMLSILGTIIGARLGHVFLYDWPYYRENPIAIFKIWEGGLASHGAAVGLLIAFLIFTWWHRKKFPYMTFLVTLDAAVMAAAFAGGCIRIGNFINQEILGTPTKLPWGVIFLHPIDGPRGIALHPVQLYESFFYFFVFAVLWFSYKRSPASIGRGLLTALFFILVFTFRFFIEFLKLPLSRLLEANAHLSPNLSMGQLLSIPFILLGIALLITYPHRKARAK